MKQNNVYDSPSIELLEIELDGQIAVSLTEIDNYYIEEYVEGEAYTW